MSSKADKRKGTVDQNQKIATRPQRMADAPPQSMAENQKAALRMGIKIAPIRLGINIRMIPSPRTSTLDLAMTVSQISDQ